MIGFAINDAEPALFGVSREGDVIRRERAWQVAEGLPQRRSPDTLIFRLRVAQLVWSYLEKRRTSTATVAYYRSLYAENWSGRVETLCALDEIVATCRARGIPCYVVIFPILYELGDQYPFREIHALVERVTLNRGGIALDLLPVLRTRQAEEFWVHPTDQHPNEVAQMKAAEALTAKLRSSPGFLQRVQAAAGEVSGAQH